MYWEPRNIRKARKRLDTHRMVAILVLLITNHELRITIQDLGINHEKHEIREKVEKRLVTAPIGCDTRLTNH